MDIEELLKTLDLFDEMENETGLNTVKAEKKEIKESLNEDTKLTVKECDETVIISVYTKSLITQKVLEKFKNIEEITYFDGKKQKDIKLENSLFSISLKPGRGGFISFKK